MVSKRLFNKKSTPARRRGDSGDATHNPQNYRSGQYRQNQTLHGYTTPTHSEEESSRHKAHQLVLQRRRLMGGLSIVLLVVVLLGLLLWQLIATVHVTTSTKQLSKPLDSKQYETSINEYLTINPAQRLRYALDEAKLSQFVSSTHPEVAALSLNDGFGVAQANMTITIREPVAGWQMNNKQYYVDANGVVFDKNYYNEPTIQIVDESNIVIEQGSTVAGGRLLGFLGKVVAQAQSRGYTIVKASLPQGTTRELDIYLSEYNNIRLKLSIDRKAGEQLEDASRSLTFLTQRGIHPEYIDVRVAGRAAYR